MAKTIHTSITADRLIEILCEEDNSLYPELSEDTTIINVSLGYDGEVHIVLGEE